MYENIAYKNLLIRDRRIAMGLSQEELGRRMGYTSGSAVSQYETGARNPKIETLEKIAKALNIELGELINP